MSEGLEGYAPLGADDWPEDIADMREGFAGDLNVYRTMAHHPALLAAWTDLREHIVNRTALGPELSEVAILRGGHMMGSEYEWKHHILRARARGLSDDRVRSIAGPLAGMAPLDALVAGGVDALLADHALSADQVAGLERALGKTAVFDLIATVGFYSVLAGLLKTFGVPLDDFAAEALRRDPFPA